jgi:hypothetical protein
VAAHVGEMKQVYTLLNQKDICMFACGRKFFCLIDLAAIIALLHDACMRDQSTTQSVEGNDLTFFGDFKNGRRRRKRRLLVPSERTPARRFPQLGLGISRVSA